MRRTLGALALACLGVIAWPAWSAGVISPSGIDARLSIDWEAGQTRKGQPVIRGYVINDYGRPASDVRVLVEVLDAAGQPIERQAGFVFGTVPGNGGRSYFEVPLRTAGAGYRVTITAYDWRGGGS
jgi:hypothetical protein